MPYGSQVWNAAPALHWATGAEVWRRLAPAHGPMQPYDVGTIMVIAQTVTR